MDGWMDGWMGPSIHKNLSAETRVKISEAKKGKCYCAETKAKMSEAKGTLIYLYDSHGSLVNTFLFARKAAEYFKVCHKTIIKYTRNGRMVEWMEGSPIFKKPSRPAGWFF